MSTRVTHLLGAGLLTLFAGNSCSYSSGSGGGGGGVSNPVQAYVVENSVLAFSGIARTRLLLPVVLLPSMHAAAGITFTLDTSPGAAPNTYDLSIPLDSDGDGVNETTIDGTVVLSTDPTLGGVFVSGFQCSADITVTTLGGMGVFTGMLDLFFDFGGGFRVSGTGTYVDSATNATVTVTADPLDPLHIRTADERPDRRPNACVWTIDGAADVAASNADGDYSANWSFQTDSKLITVTNAAFTPTGGTQESLPDSSFEAAPCPMTGTLGDWVGNYTFDWFCPPTEMGQSALTITLISANTIEITDESPPGSGTFLVYQAVQDANDPHVVHGELMETDSNGTYEEGFTWILSNDGTTFRQVSEFFYLSGPLAGSTGDCGGLAVRN